MLTIKRRQGERIMIGDDIVVKIVEVSGSTVRVGIVAPLSYSVYREEIWNRVRQEDQADSAAAPDIESSGTTESDSSSPGESESSSE